MRAARYRVFVDSLLRCKIATDAIVTFVSGGGDDRTCDAFECSDSCEIRSQPAYRLRRIEKRNKIESVVKDLQRLRSQSVCQRRRLRNRRNRPYWEIHN